MSRVKKLVFSGLCLALGIVLPLAFHSIVGAGAILLPMHIPVLLCGLVCGWPYGLLVGTLTPLLSSVLTGMPPAPILPGMMCELAVYGFVSGLLITRLPVKKDPLRLYLSLLIAMLCGRITYGLLNSFIFMAGNYSLQLWLTTAFVTGLPGIAAQLLLLPAIVLALRRARIISE